MTFLITAGPTREPIDPVRYLSNHSSGKMGYAIAAAAAKKGHRVILISGPTILNVPDGCDLIPVETAADMSQAVGNWIARADIVIMAAAVADFRPVEYKEQKIKKTPGSDRMTLELIKNPDILVEAKSVHDYEGLLVGFAAETENVLHNAREKLNRKKCDIILANDVSHPGEGFNSDQNTIIAVFPNEEKELGSHSKAHLGGLIVALCEDCVRN